MLCVFNAKSRKSALAAVSKEIEEIEYVDDKTDQDVKARKYWLDRGMTPKHIELGLIADKLLEHNKFLMPYAYTGCGLDLQHLDSRIMDIVVGYFTDRDEFVLPIHDSIVCRAAIKEDVARIMIEAYEQVMGNADNAIVEEK